VDILDQCRFGAVFHAKMIVSYEYVKLLGHNYARPMLEYHSPILWSPVAVTLINQLESVQRRFTKRLPGFQTLPYDARCALLRLDRLELRRLRTDLIFCYKIIRGLVLLSADRFFTFTCTSRTLGHSFKLFLPDSRVN